MDKKNKPAELILKLSLSGLPPNFQEYVLNNIQNLNQDNLDQFIAALDKLSLTQTEYIKASEKYLQFYQDLSQEIKKEIGIKTDKIKEELLKEMINSKS